jgi:hypothetical protein
MEASVIGFIKNSLLRVQWYGHFYFHFFRALVVFVFRTHPTIPPLSDHRVFGLNIL